MSNPLIRGAFAILILTSGFAMVVYAADVAYDDADSSVEAVSTLKPVIDTGISILPWLVPLILGLTVIGGVGWLLTDGGSSSGGAFR